MAPDYVEAEFPYLGVRLGYGGLDSGLIVWAGRTRCWKTSDYLRRGLPKKVVTSGLVANI